MPLEALIPLLIWFARPGGFRFGYWDNGGWSALGWGGYLLLMLGTIWGLRRLAVARTRQWTTRSWVPSAVAFGRWQRLGMAIVICGHGAMVCLGPLGSQLEGVTAGWKIGSGGELELVKTLVSALPAYAAMMGLWWAAYPVSLAARESAALDALEADLPVRFPPSAGAMIAMMARMRLGLVVAQWVLLAVIGDGLSSLFKSVGRPLDEVSRVGVLIGSVMGVALLSPLVVRFVLPTRRLPDGKLRERLAALTSAAGVRLGGIFIWDTQGTSANAMVSGFVWPLRYVFLSDHLLETFTDEQIEAVMAHELGHVRGRHVMWFAVLMTGMSMALQLFEPWVGSTPYPLESMVPGGMGGGVAASWWWALAASAVAVGGGVGILLAGFIPLSRAFEGQADLDGARLVSGGSLKEDGAAQMAGALLRVAQVNGIPPEAENLTHGSIMTRMARVTRRSASVGAAEGFDRQLRLVKVGLMLGWVGAMVALVRQH
jgi:STE24 endopeptidase